MQLSSHIHICEEKPNSSRTLKSVWTCCHDVRTNATLNYSKLFDTDGCPDTWLGHPNGNLRSNFSKLESTQNLLWTSWNTFLKRRLWKILHPWLKQQHYKIVILSNRLQPTQTNKLPIWLFRDKNHLTSLKIHSRSKTKNTPPFCLKMTNGKQSIKTRYKILPLNVSVGQG
jgi:hypothetical protein